MIKMNAGIVKVSICKLFLGIDYESSKRSSNQESHDDNQNECWNGECDHGYSLLQIAERIKVSILWRKRHDEIRTTYL